jgi:hypothetical protein
MNPLIHQLDQFNRFLNLEGLTSVQILEKGKWLATILDLDNSIAKPPLFYTYNDHVFVDYFNVWYDDYYKHLTVNKIYLQLIKKLMCEIIGKFKIRLYHMRCDANFDYFDSAYVLFSTTREEYNLLTRFDIQCFSEYEIMDTD